ncbi:nuclear cap-binding protein subunit 1 [Dorcoceras hygrometricum]|uniref:Nuclear cap-binding protein subunit 1 n=1 Tax=Dorcoceras hygrometricum TaxID=472368 RepID=A0A2Z7CTV9_9LAMI|nr:nuclear cap-binding protein subunit 1 [Dorcoceras hygrometricum]
MQSHCPEGVCTMASEKDSTFLDENKLQEDSIPTKGHPHGRGMGKGIAELGCSEQRRWCEQRMSGVRYMNRKRSFGKGV